MEGIVENLQLEIEGKFCGFSVEQLIDFAEFLKVDITDCKDKGRRVLTKKLREEFDKLVEEHEDKLSFVKEVLKYVSGDTPNVETTEKQAASVDDEYEQAKKEYEELQKKVKMMVQDQNKLLEAAKQKVELTKDGLISVSTPENGSTKGSTTDVIAVSNISNMQGSLLRREFKISGTIGGDSTKDKLSFVGLIRQIDSGLMKGYQEREIVDAVVRAISSGSKLKSYLEITTNITLPKLRQILRAHYQEKSVSELYQELTSLVQGPKESPSDFLLRALSLRERVIFTSQAEDTGIRYEPSLVRSLFTHAVETGLRDEIVRNKLRPVLHKTEITDEELMESLNKIVSVESERQLKLGTRNAKQSPAASVTVIEGHTSVTEDNAKSKQAKKAQQSFNLQATLEAVQAELAELRMKVNSPTGPHNNSTSGNRRRKFLCKTCEERNADRCEHCFKCGSKDHLARGCKAVQMSGNGAPLQPRDGK